MVMGISGKHITQCFIHRTLNMVGCHLMLIQCLIGKEVFFYALQISKKKMEKHLTFATIFRYHPRSNEFSELLAKTGMYRNYSLNTVMDKSPV